MIYYDSEYLTFCDNRLPLPTMTQVRKKTLISTFIIYIGFAIGAINTYLFAKQNFFTTEEYGLTRVFIDTCNILIMLSMLGSNAVVVKFFPFYKRNLKPEENDLLGGAYILTTIGFAIVFLAGWLGQDLFIRKFSERAHLLVKYYYWLFPFTFFFALYTVTESYAWHLQKITITNFLRETLFRFLTTILIVFRLFDLISFHTFMILFALQYALLFLILLFYLIKTQGVKLVFSISKVTKKFYKKILTLATYIYCGSVIHTVALFIGPIIIAATSSLGDAGIYTFANYFVSILQAPQRSIISMSVPLLSNAWKDKDYGAIQRIYERSSINMLLISILLFFIMWLGMDTAIDLFHVNPDFHRGKIIFLLLSIYWIIELGTGVNAQIIGTSNDWRFEFTSGVVLLALSIPTNYFFVKHFGMVGAAYSGLISITVYNTIRFLFIWKKYKLQPFSFNTVKLLVIAGVAYSITYVCTKPLSGFTFLATSSVLFTLLYLLPVYFWNVTPDIKPVVNTAMKRLRIKK
ncbi:lipopolysaccharide biosynthesis protein [Chitinophagaceae bacterium LWZ2-11]